MQSFKSYFRYNKRQRNGIFYLLILFFLLQGFYYYIDIFYRESIPKSIEISSLQSQIDSLKLLKKPIKRRTFNPNYITDEKGYLLGMSIQEIDRLLLHRSKGLWVNSFEDFQKVTQISDSLLKVLAPQFYFPNFNKKKERQFNKIVPVIKGDLNTVDPNGLMKIKGMNKKISERIVKYRSLLGGFSMEIQLYEVWGLSKNNAKNILHNFEIKSKPKISKVNINSASFKEVLSIVYLDYETTKSIFSYKKSVEKILDLEELKKIEGFPTDKYDRIVLYLRVE